MSRDGDDSEDDAEAVSAPEEDLAPEAPIPEAPEVPDYSAVEAPPDLAATFWAVVALVNVGLFGISLGPMLVVFRGQYETGVAAFAIGAVALALAYRRYRIYRRERDAAERADR